MRGREVQGKDSSDIKLEDAQVALGVSLSANQYTGVSGNAHTQANHYAGWNYIGITPICRLAARATVDIFDERKHEVGKEKAKSLRRETRSRWASRFGPQWKSFLDESGVAEQASDTFRWWNLLDNRPNPWQSAGLQRWERILQLHIHGLCMVWNVRNRHGKTVWRFVLPMSMLTPITPGMNDMPFGGVHVHTLNWALRVDSDAPRARLENAIRKYTANRQIPMEDITMTAYPHPKYSGEGMSPSTAIEDWIAAVRAAESTERKHFERGPEQVVLIQQPDSDSEGGITTTESLNAFQRRLDKRIKSREGLFVAMPRHGAVTPVGFSPDEMAYSRTGEFHGPNIMSAHGTPRAAVGQSEGMTYGSNAATLQAFNWMSVQSDLDLLADDDTMTMQQEEGDVFVAEYTAPEYNDPELEERRLENDLSSGSLTGQEARQIRGREPFGDKRDKLTAGSSILKEFDPDNPDGPPQPGGMPGMPGAPAMPKPGGAAQPEMPKFGQPKPSESSELPKPKQPNTSESANPETERKNWGLITKSISTVGDCLIAVDLGMLTQNRVYADGLKETSLGGVNESTVAAVRTLKNAGCKIVVFTYLSTTSIVKRWLNEHKIPFDAINDVDQEAHAVIGDHLPVDAETDRIIEDVITQLESSVIDQKWIDVIDRQKNKAGIEQELGFLFVPIGGQMANLVNGVQKQIDQDDWAGDGKEDELHITVMYGLIDADTVDMAKVSKHVLPPKFKLSSKISVFEGGHFEGREDVAIVIELIGNGLQTMRSQFASRFAHLESYPVYRPHITLGYVKKDAAHKYEKLKVPNAASIVERLVFRSPGQSDVVLPLSEKIA